MMSEYPRRIDLCEGKYSVIYDLHTGQSECLRYGEKWRDLCGDKMVLAMFDAIIELRAENAELKPDAMRYRWLRDAGATFYTGVDTDQEKEHHVCEQAMDTAIDKAMQLVLETTEAQDCDG